MGVASSVAELPVPELPGTASRNCLSHRSPQLKREEAKVSWTICPIPVRPFDYIVKAGQPAARRPLQDKGEIMAQYLVAIRHPDPHDPSAEDEAMSRDIDAQR